MALGYGQRAALTGRRPTVRIEDLQRARLPSLYAARERALMERRIGMDEEVDN